jgi:hypothetical protein
LAEGLESSKKSVIVLEVKMTIPLEFIEAWDFDKSFAEQDIVVKRI